MKEQIDKEVTFTEVSWPLKMAVIFAWTSGILNLIGFIIGFVEGFSAA